MGDASGVGPEIIMKSLGHAEVYGYCRPLVIGDAGRLREAGRIVGSVLKVNAVSDLSKANYQPADRGLRRPEADSGKFALGQAFADLRRSGLPIHRSCCRTGQNRSD